MRLISRRWILFDWHNSWVLGHVRLLNFLTDTIDKFSFFLFEDVCQHSCSAQRSRYASVDSIGHLSDCFLIDSLSSILIESSFSRHYSCLSLDSESWLRFLRIKYISISPVTFLQSFLGLFSSLCHWISFRLGLLHDSHDSLQYMRLYSTSSWREISLTTHVMQSHVE